jgi:rhodanese-related sulfurtransferase
MSSLNISHLARMSRESLAAILASPAASKLAIVDVRDSGSPPPPPFSLSNLHPTSHPTNTSPSDHIGGHIRSSIWVPSSELDVKTPELIRTLKDKDKVVFHCALSQERGPSAALRYARERQRLLPAGEREGQQVYVLDGGFTMWQAKYGEDEKLTEGYVKDIWMDY